jgi:hypothetical protein
MPIDCISVDTLKGRSVLYRRTHSIDLLEAGRRPRMSTVTGEAA